MLQRVEMLLPARRKGVEGCAGGEFHTRHYKMEFMVPGVAVAHPQDVILVRLQAGKGGSLKVIHQLFFLFRRDHIFRPPGTDPGAEFPLAGLGVNQGAGQSRVAAQNLWR